MCLFVDRFTILFLSMSILVFVSCGQEPAHEAQPASESQASTDPIAEHMGEHYEQVAAAQNALIRGNLDEAGFKRETDLVRKTLREANKPHFNEFLQAWK